jgi:hypothetical protein
VMEQVGPNHRVACWLVTEERTGRAASVLTTETQSARSRAEQGQTATGSASVPSAPLWLERPAGEGAAP